MTKLNELLSLLFSIILIEHAASQTEVTISGKNYVVYTDLVNRASAIALCSPHNARLVDFDNLEEQMAVADYFYFNDWPYQRVYWTDGMRTFGQPDVFFWETTGKSLDASVKWMPFEPSSDLTKSYLYFLTETKGLISGQASNFHSVICEKN